MSVDESPEPISLRGEATIAAWIALAFGAASFFYCFRHELLLLYGDSVAHLYIARRVIASRNPGIRQLGSVWLPLPHILLLPFVAISDWWRNGVAGALVSIPSYVLACAGIYRLARIWLPISSAILAFAFFALNPGLLYMATTAMTEPLFLAEMIWTVVLLVLFEDLLYGPPPEARPGTFRAAKPATRDAAPGKGRQGKPAPRPFSAGQLLIRAGLVLVAAVFTRYDGWILAAAAWCVITVRLGLHREAYRKLAGAWKIFTALLLASPAAWMVYNWIVFGDPLDFLRGPYSARAIEARTAPPGNSPHPGFHNLYVSALYFLKASELGATPLRFGNILLCLGALGTLLAIFLFRRQRIWPALLLWLPLPFYCYAIAYGSIPVFIPLWWPFSWYNTRYGLEMLPAFALFGAVCCGTLIAAIPRFAPKFGDRFERKTAAVLLSLIVWNCIVLLRARPLVFAEALANSRSRIAFEQGLSRALISLPQQGLILMYTSQDAGALQLSGLPLKRIIDEGDNLEWKHGLENPALAAPILVALEGDPVAQAIRAHPQGLELEQVICSTGQPCARIYHSTVYTPGLPLPASPAGGS